MRKPLQGVTNIIRFNWHFYALALAITMLLAFIAGFVGRPLQGYLYLTAALVLASTGISLLASLYVYDLSGLYRLNWVDRQSTEKMIVNINAGFDETSALLQDRFAGAELVALDFYDPAKHSEVSIKRARRAYPPFPGTRQTVTHELPLPDASADKVFVILAAHEIRDEKERALFFSELHRVLKPTGQLYITEHLRDVPNLMAYNIGFFHFYSKLTWLRAFENAKLNLQREIKLTPFISTFILAKHGTTLNGATL
ncbi:class I SAM-dependent methyltransferase [Pontibacter sp. MBLB2868]|uniref:class I SAM-dependent methyltransferase n=1 Tax=Pontibacter sp. MBLB2868 TaxID=3451555 RepID=UPI003F751C13